MLRNLNIVCIGIGSQGSRFLKKLEKVKPKLLSGKSKINVQLFGVADKNKKLRSDFSDAYKKYQSYSGSPELIIADTLGDFVTQFLKKNYQQKKPSASTVPIVPILIYDATPTPCHIQNLGIIRDLLYTNKELNNKIFYFGEKPLLTDEDQIKSLKDMNIPFWVDFIELYSSTFLTLVKLINKRSISINRIKTWRVSSIALEKLLLNKRKETMGGALEDKMIHDLALAYGLLSKTINIANNFNLSYEVLKSRILTFMPASINGITKGTGIFETCIGNKTGALNFDEQLFLSEVLGPAADTSFSFKVKWKLQEQNGQKKFVDTDFCGSWLGLYDFPDLKKLCDDIKENLVNYDYCKFGEKDTKFNSEETRVWAINAHDKENKPVTIICNFLNREGIKPKIVLLHSGKNGRETITVPDEDSIETILNKVIIDCFNFMEYGNYNESLITNGNAYLVHKLMCDAKKKAFENYYDQYCEMKKIQSKFLSYLTP